jgi:hypothetical protein
VAPAFLISQEQFKVLIVRNGENVQCTCTAEQEDGLDGSSWCMYQFPAGYDCGDTTSDDFLTILSICIMATSHVDSISDDIASSGDFRSKLLQCRDEKSEKFIPTPQRTTRGLDRNKNQNTSSSHLRQANNQAAAKTNIDSLTMCGRKQFPWFVNQKLLAELEQADENDANVGNDANAGNM